MAQPPSHTDSASSDENSVRNSANSDPILSGIEDLLSVVGDWPGYRDLQISTEEGDLRPGQFTAEHSVGYASSSAMFPDEQARARNGIYSQFSDGFDSDFEWFLYNTVLRMQTHDYGAFDAPLSSSQDSFVDAPAGSLDDSRKRLRKGLRGSSAARSHASTSSSRSQASTSSLEVVNTDHSSSRPESEDSESRSSRHSDEIRPDGRSSRPSSSLVSSAYFSGHSVDIA